MGEITLRKALDDYKTVYMAYRNFAERTRIVEALAELRREWQQTANGGSLLKVEAPVGLLLSDIADRLELTSQERYAMLGGKLINEVDALLEERVSRRLPL